MTILVIGSGGRESGDCRKIITGRSRWRRIVLDAGLTGFLTAAIGLLSLLCVCLFVFGRLGAGPVVAFLIAGLVLGQINPLPAETAHQLHEIADLGVVLLLFAIGLEM